MIKFNDKGFRKTNQINLIKVGSMWFTLLVKVLPIEDCV